MPKKINAVDIVQNEALAVVAEFLEDNRENLNKIFGLCNNQVYMSITLETTNLHKLEQLNRKTCCLLFVKQQAEKEDAKRHE